MTIGIEQRVVTILVDTYGLNPERLDPTADFENDYDMDSLDRIEFLMAIEEEFGIEIDDPTAIGIKTVADLVEHLEGRIP